jgi:hypothetical protein
MTAAGYSLVITATDKATAPIRAVNKELSALAAPIQRAAGAMREFGQVPAVATSVRALGALGPVAGAIGLAGVALAKLAAETQKWADYTNELGNVGRRAGLTANAMGAMEGAMRLAGGSAQGAAGAMIALKDKIFDIRSGRAPEVLGFLSAFGIGLDSINKGTETAESMLPKLYAGLRRIADPTAQFRIASQFFGGGTEDMLKLINSGKLPEFLAAAKGAMANPNTVAAAEYIRAAALLAESAEGLGNSLLGKFVAGGMTGLMDNASSALKRLKDGVEGWTPPLWFRVLTGAEDVPPSVQIGLNRIKTFINEEIAWITSPDRLVLPSIGGGSSVGAAVSRAEIGAPQKTIAQQIIDRLTAPDKGWTREQAIGMVANLYDESGLQPNTGEIDSDKKWHAGLARWDPSRQEAFRRMFGHGIAESTVDEQVDFIHAELTGTEGRAGDELRRARTVGEAGEAFARYYERPAGGHYAWERRGDDAERWNREMAPASTGHVRVDVHINGAPEGTTGTATASGAASVSPPRIVPSGVGR